MFSAYRIIRFVWARQPADAYCVISIELYSELLNHVKKCQKSVKKTESLLGMFQSYDTVSSGPVSLRYTAISKKSSRESI